MIKKWLNLKIYYNLHNNSLKRLGRLNNGTERMTGTGGKCRVNWASEIFNTYYTFSQQPQTLGCQL